MVKFKEIDGKWLTEYAESEDDQVSITALMKQLSESSTRGGKVSPLYFNAKSYKSSEVYKDLQEQRKEDEAYLKVKKKEAEERKRRELNADLARQVSNPREYLKAADKIGITNLHQDQRSLYMKYMEEELKRGATIGLLDAGKDFAKDIFNFVMDPEAAEMAVYESVIHYKQTYKIMAKAIHDSYEKNMVHGDWYSRAHWVTYAIGSAFANVAGTKGMGAAAKTGMATARIVTKNVVSKAGKLAQIPSKTPLEYSFAKDGQVPYNAINSKGLMDRLSAFSDEGKVGKVTIKSPSAFANRAKLEGHFDKHGKEFDGLYKNADEYLEGAKEVINNGIKVKYEYKGEIRTGYVKFMGNNKNGKAKFEFVGTNNNGDITTYHTQSGKKMWKTINGENIPVINPAE